MTRTYSAVLRGDRLEWTGPEPANPGPVNVLVTVDEAEEPSEAEARRHEAVDALERIARRGGIKSIPDPVAWQREVRRDRVLPGREE